MALIGREGLGPAVDRGRRCVDDLFDPAATAASKTLKVPPTSTSMHSRGRSAQSVIRMAAWWKTKSQPDGALATIARSRTSPSRKMMDGGPSPGEVFQTAPDQVIQHPDLAHAPVDQAIDDVGANQPRPPVTRTWRSRAIARR